MIIYANTELGPVYGHGGWVPGYVSSLRHYADYDFTIAFQIDTDVGIVDDSADLISALEAALAKLLTDAVCLSQNHPFMQRDLAGTEISGLGVSNNGHTTQLNVCSKRSFSQFCSTMNIIAH